MEGSWSSRVSPGMTDTQLKEYIEGIITHAKGMEKKAYQRDDSLAAEYWIGKTVAASSILMHLEARM